MQLSRKKKKFFQFFFAFCKPAFNFEPFQKEDDLHS